ncbi:MAG: hypothetical protein HYV07_12865 [Deltaproteobacteria bacterium]|nr:hypothetical protein [Deltaproteobacteria bacterium]
MQRAAVVELKSQLGILIAESRSRDCTDRLRAARLALHDAETAFAALLLDGVQRGVVRQLPDDWYEVTNGARFTFHGATPLPAGFGET